MLHLWMQTYLSVILDSLIIFAYLYLQIIFCRATDKLIIEVRCHLEILSLHTLVMVYFLYFTIFLRHFKNILNALREKNIQTCIKISHIIILSLI